MTERKVKLDRANKISCFGRWEMSITVSVPAAAAPK